MRLDPPLLVDLHIRPHHPEAQLLQTGIGSLTDTGLLNTPYNGLWSVTTVNGFGAPIV